MPTYLETQRSMDHSAYVAYWKEAKEYFKHNPDGYIPKWGLLRSMHCYTEWLSLAEFKAEMRSALLDRILCRAGTPIICNSETINFQVDRQNIENYLFRRYRHSGCRNLLLTKQLKKRYPHIDNQPATL